MVVRNMPIFSAYQKTILKPLCGMLLAISFLSALREECLLVLLSIQCFLAIPAARAF